MNDFVFTGKISINEFCAHKAYTKSTCNQCVKICPFEALVINFDNKVLVLDCIGCGICYNVCENDAIELYKNTDAYIIKNTIEPSFGCIFAEGENKVSCISRLSENLIVFFVLKFGYLKIHKGRCDSCKFQKTLEVFDNALNKAKAILKALNVQANIEVLESPSAAFEPNLGISRREIIAKKENYPKRNFLIELIKDNIENHKVEYTGTINLLIDKNCNFCSICETVCPKGAIIIEKEETAAIYFNPSLCSACRSCIDACPENAIKESKAFVDDLIPKAVKLFERPKKICACGNVHYTDSETCPECEIKNKKRQELLNYVKDLF